MKLTKENIFDWKNQLDKLMKEFLPQSHKYSDCNSDQTWLETYEGCYPEDVKDDEIYYSSQN